MTPYYEDPDGIVIYRGDCREILPQLGPVDLVLTDPPYGIKRDGMRPSTSSHGGRKAYDFLGWDNAPPTDGELRLLLSAGRDAVLWGANYFPAALPPSMGWLVWDKGQRICSSDAELAFTTAERALRVFTLNRVALMQDGAEHPTQKPVRLMLWCLDQFPEARTVLDPYMGSGSTLVACKRRGLSCVGIEREEKYCEIAAERLRREEKPLFAAIDREQFTLGGLDGAAQ